MGLSVHSPVRPSWPHLPISVPLRRRDFEKIASACASVSDLIGLSLLTKIASASTDVRITRGLYPNFFSKASDSVSFGGRDIGPIWAVPAMRAGMAVPEPLPSIWMLTFG